MLPVYPSRTPSSSAIALRSMTAAVWGLLAGGRTPRSPPTGQARRGQLLRHSETRRHRYGARGAPFQARHKPRCCAARPAVRVLCLATLRAPIQGKMPRSTASKLPASCGGLTRVSLRCSPSRCLEQQPARVVTALAAVVSGVRIGAHRQRFTVTVETIAIDYHLPPAG